MGHALERACGFLSDLLTLLHDLESLEWAVDLAALVSNGTGVLANGAAAAVLLSNSTIQANGVALN